MSSRLRAAVLGLLMLLIPLQGFAASSMVLCLPLHHGQGGQATDRGHEAATDHAGQHTAQHATEHAADHSAHHGAAVDDADGQSGSAKCSVCASCCHTAAPPSAVLTAPAVAPGSAQIPWSPLSHFGYLTGGLDRPPRPALA